jgi:uncharacterized RDD family membrane protein YckC
MDLTARRLPDPALCPDLYDHTPAKRALAWVVDTAVIALGVAATVLLTFFVSLFFLPVIWIAVGFAYRAATLARGSATWGMRLLAIEIRDSEGRRLDLGTALAHTTLYYVAMAMLPVQILSAGLMVATPRRQGLGDHLLGTAALNRVD